MRLKAGTIGVLVLLLLAAMQFLWWTQVKGGAQSPRHRASRSGRGGMALGGLQGGHRGAFREGGSRSGAFGAGQFNISLESRLIATLASQAGPFTVSVRNVRSVNDERALVRVLPYEDGPLGSFYLYLQVIGPADQAPLCRLDLASITALDDTGRRIAHQPVPGDVLTPVAFSGGAVYVARMGPPAPQARVLSRVDGNLFVRRRGLPDLRLPFTIVNSPLPNAPRLFGRAAPLSVPASNGLPVKLAVFTGDAAKQRFKNAESVQLSMLYRPQRVIFGFGAPVNLGVPIPEDPHPIRLRVDPGELGFLNITVRDGKDSWTGCVWDGEPLVIVRAGAVGRNRSAVAIRLSRDSTPPDSVPPPPPPFPAPARRPGGAIAMRIRVGHEPFGSGLLTLTLRQRLPGGWTEPRQVIARLRANGECRLFNLAAGEYRLERPISALAPPFVMGIPAYSVRQYLHTRFGRDAGRGVWRGEVVPNLMVREAQTTVAPPLQWSETAGVTARR